MCGISGIWERSGCSRQDLKRRASAMTQTLSHRGPDDSGVWLSEQASIAFGQRRLAIIDLSPLGHQPMVSANGQYAITFNGEIYNFRELRAELERCGVRFRGHSDTEVIVEGFAQWGVKSTIARLNGMFAIAAWDAAERQLFLARDRMGEKPLYWAVFDGLVLFGSELKALRAHPGWKPSLNRGAIAAFLRHGYVPGPFTIYEDVYKLPPAGFVKIASGGGIEVGMYWDLAGVVSQGQRNTLRADEEGLVDELEALLHDAVSRRMISDVPLGAFLSGGYDSSTVVALMQKASQRPVKTFTISFENPAFDEAKHAEAVARHLETDHTTFPVSGADALDVVPKLAEMYDEPFADSSQIPTHIVSALTRKRVTVALSGDGGDELFSGYDRYQWTENLWRPSAKMPLALRRLVSASIRAVPPSTYNSIARYVPHFRRVPRVGQKAHRLAQILSESSIDSMYYHAISYHQDPAALVKGSQEVRTVCWDQDLKVFLPDPVDRMRYLDMCTYLPDDILTKVDRASMAVALEVRVPFLDHRVVEWVWRLPTFQNARAPRPKHLLRRVLARHVPDRLVERPKMGFGVPLPNWLRGPLRNWAEDLMNEAGLSAGDIFDVEAVRSLWEEFLNGDNASYYLIWHILMFQAWHRQWRYASVADTETRRLASLLN
ncbi:asparagine synthase (glutamine-hydrolyzing) [Bradyrhizobium sp. CCBAU 051011]|uniref:asparagine synthase (glutamine-hydrolyzing) n=1 Tax=Bradyrhizobium sp. CCBAU 051011 TaxID=858422 RepID=UPI001373E219|nr:asparagine synthase (glutamine-hydrolyzing) [Bradyrhizobium sp. CCBAU 051011]QHO72375.1 asparagine synthase (glutamine-hydrolyzing) [Bradyrhizobium sp. CCBAU 051011]